MHGLAALAATAALCTPIRAFAQSPAPARLDQHVLFRVAGALYHLDPALLEAIAKVESDDNPYAISPKGARGLMQLMPATARQFGVDDPDDPVGSTLGAAKFLDYLRRLQLEKGGPSPGLAALIAAYNAGPGAVDKYNGIPPYPETQAYVRKVLLDYIFGPTAVPSHTRIVRREATASTAIVAKKTPVDPLIQLVEIQRKRTAILQAQESNFALSAEGKR